MSVLRRIALFLITNMLVIFVISIVMSFLGFDATTYSGLLVLCAIFGMAGSFISLLLSKQIAKWSYQIKIIDPASAHGKDAYVYDVIDKMSASLGIVTPQVGIYQSREVNAFATGAYRDSSLIAFSSQIIESLNDDELAAVAGHELSHIKNGDMVTMTLLVGIANTFVMFFARIIASAMSFSGGDNRRRDGFGTFGYWMLVRLMENVLMLLAYIPICAFSRKREFHADRGAAELINPVAMIGALEKIERFYFPQQKKDSFALAKIENRHRVSLYATHPSIADRISYLRSLP